MEQSDFLQNINGILPKKNSFFKITFTFFIFFQFDSLIRETPQKHKLPEVFSFLVQQRGKCQRSTTQQSSQVFSSNLQKT